MKTKSVITGILLIFVAVSVGYLVVQEVRSGEAKPEDKAKDKKAKDEKGKGEKGSEKAGSKKALPGKVVVYYFHTNFRCATCRKFEKYAKELMKSEFKEQIKSGVLEWRVVNIETDENKHFIKDYKLFTKSIIVSKVKDGKQTEWKNLKKIWSEVANKAGFMKYVKDEIKAYMGKADE